MDIKTCTFEMHGDDRGELIAIEANQDIPFEVKRVYYIFDTKPGVRRGFHSHKKLEQILLCVHGSCKIMLDNGHEKADILLDSPDKGLYVGYNTWREMYDFSEDAVLLVLASEHYNEEDYIRDYDKFLESIAE